MTGAPSGTGSRASHEAAEASSPKASIPSAALMEIVGDELWRRTKTDWVLTVNHDLTEPTCPTATIRPADEDENWQRWRADRDTIEDAIETVLAVAHAALFAGSADTGVPWSNPRLKPIPPATSEGGDA